VDAIIVSRHPGAVKWLRQQIPALASAPVMAEATPDDVRGKVVFGNVPFHLAAAARMVVAVQFTGKPPRSREYDVEDMEKAGAHLQAYIVRPAKIPVSLSKLWSSSPDEIE